jgi:hypothetical protein
MRIADTLIRPEDALTFFPSRNRGILALGILLLTLAGCLGGERAGDTDFEEKGLGGPLSPGLQIHLPTASDAPLSFVGVRARNDTLFFLESGTGDLWTLALADPGASAQPELIRRLRGSDYALPTAAALLFWEGSLGFLDRDGTFWTLEGDPPEAVFPFRPADAPETPSNMLVRDAVVMGDSLLVATSMMLIPPSASSLPRMSVELMVARAGGVAPESLTTLAEGMTSTARFFALTEGRDSLWVVDPVRRLSMAPFTDSTQAWIPRPGLSYRLPTAEDLAAMQGLQQQIGQMARQLGSNLTAGLLPDHQPSMRRGYWHGPTLWSMAQSSPGFVLDGYCNGIYQGTVGPQVSAIHFAPPYWITVTLAEDLETDNLLRIHALSDLPDLCREPDLRSAPLPPHSP